MKSTRKGVLLITQEDAIAKMCRIHNGFYTYENTVFLGATASLTVTCPLHGDFTSTYTNHTHKTSPRGCPSCGRAKSASKRIIPGDDFVNKAKAIHGEVYDYSKVVYTKRDAKVEIICKAHGSFRQSSEKHLTGQGCIVCSGRAVMTAARFAEIATERHIGRYSYSAIEDRHFDTANTGRKVPITCSVHGTFHQHFGNHIQGQGCRKCATFGFKVMEPANLYVLSCGDITKVGVTNRKPALRARQVSAAYGREFVVEKSYEFDSGNMCLDLETHLLQALNSKYKPLVEKFNGSTECFLDVDTDWLYGVIEQAGEYRQERCK